MTVSLTAHAEETPKIGVDFARDVHPIFASRCLGCHGAKKQEGGLRFDIRRDAFQGGDGGAVIVPKKSAESTLLDRVTAQDIDERMPPEGPPLTAGEIAALKHWIDAGAPWPDELANENAAVVSDHWSFQAPRRPNIPAVGSDARLGSPIDNFVIRRLQEVGLEISPEADRGTLVRRLYLDLLGLPPTPAQADAFMADTRPDAYVRLVDELLASPHFGERWARRWLDLARYADTNGYEKDRERSIWAYRDWVINAFNADMPFDQFTVEQIAGDMLPKATLEQRIATGFHRNTMLNEEGGVDVEEFRYHATVDRANTTGTVWLGLTVGCAQCHTHKYDPITQREYFQFLAFLNNADEPDLTIPVEDISAQRTEILQRIAEIERAMLAHMPELQAGFHAWKEQASEKSHDWQIVRPIAVTSQNHATMTVLTDGSVLASGDIPNLDLYELEMELADTSPITALRLEVLPHQSLPDQGPGRSIFHSGAGAKGDFLLSEFSVEIAPPPEAETESGAKSRRPVKLVDPTESHTLAKRSAALTLDGSSDTGWSIGKRTGEAHHAVYQLAEPLSTPEGERLKVTLDMHYIHQMTIGRFRLSVTRAPLPVVSSGLPAAIEEILQKPATDRSPADSKRLEQYYSLIVAAELEPQRKQIAELRQGLSEFPTTMVLEERSPEHQRTTHIHHRGEFLTATEVVEPDVPGVLHDLPADAPRNRLTLAHWLVDEKNPLVARVTMNRMWGALFGRGLVRTPEDFGIQGAPPTHPELLDWLAVEFMESDWSLKQMLREMVTSNTYRQTSRSTAEQLNLDPQNQWLSHMPRVRVDAEQVRDIALSAAGLLSQKINGPSVFPPQPDGVTALSYGTLNWQVSPGEDRYRRGLYTFTKRTSPYATFMLFDAPSGENCAARRERSNTPLQALTMLNDRVIVEAAQVLAQQVLATTESNAADARIEAIFRRCLTRRPTASELQQIQEFYQRQLARFNSRAVDARLTMGLTADEAAPENLNQLAAWTTVARAILNLDETITRE